MDIVYTVKNAPFAATTGAKTVLNILAGANQPVTLIEWGISFDGTTATAVPAIVELCQSTQATAGTPGGSAPSVVQSSGRVASSQITAQHNYTAEPTVLTPLEAFYVPQFMGMFVKQYPLGLEPDTDLSGGTIKGLAIRANVSASVNILAYVRFGIGG